MVLIQNKKIKYFALVALLTTACVFTYYKVKHIHTIESFEMPSAIRNNISDFAWNILPAFEKIEFNDPVYLVEEPGTRRLFVIEREGRIFSFNKRVIPVRIKY